MNEDIPKIRAPDIPEALPDDLKQKMRALVALREANTRDAAELARVQAEVEAGLQAELARVQAEIEADLLAKRAEIEASPQRVDRRLAESMAALGAASAELGAGVQRQGMCIAALTAALRTTLNESWRRGGERTDLERVKAGCKRMKQLLIRWASQRTAVKAWRAWLATLAASRLHDDQLGVVSPSWSLWTGRAPPAGVPIVQRQ
jgi:hypothetical protein